MNILYRLACDYAFNSCVFKRGLILGLLLDISFDDVQQFVVLVGEVREFD